MERPTTPVRRRCDRYANQPPEQDFSAPNAPEQPAPVQPALSAPQAKTVPAAPPAPRVTQPGTTSAGEARTRRAESRSAPIERSAASRKGTLQSGTPAGNTPRREPKKKEWKCPVWMTAVLVAGVIAIMACLAGEMLMRAYLTQQQRDREEAQAQVTAAHPIQYLDLIERWTDEYGLQPAFVASIILNESSYNTKAESSVGARGLMQLMPDTAEWIAHKLGMDDVWSDDLLWDAETNIRFGCWYLNYLSGLFSGDPVTVASAYHTGQGQVNTWLQNREYSPDGKALSLTGMKDGPTKTYAGRVIRDYGIYDKLYFQAFNAADAES